MVNSSFYDLLGVNRAATPEELKTAFRLLAMKYHPDKNNNSQESQALFILIRHAYETLIDHARRMEYDRYLKTSSLFRDIKNQKVLTQPVIADVPGRSLNAVTSQLNYLLWDIEDFFSEHRTIDWNRLIGGVSVTSHLLVLLIFLDQWVLAPAGYPDYFLEARKQGIPEPSAYYARLREQMSSNSSSWRPFINARDYFYNIRKRMDKLLNRVRMADLMHTFPGTDIRLIDTVLEAQRLTVHVLTGLLQALNGHGVDFEPYQFSIEEFKK